MKPQSPRKKGDNSPRSVARSFLPSEKNTFMVLSMSWTMSAGLQFTSRMAPQPLGPQTQFFCQDNRGWFRKMSGQSSASQMLTPIRVSATPISSGW